MRCACNKFAARARARARNRCDPSPDRRALAVVLSRKHSPILSARQRRWSQYAFVLLSGEQKVKMFSGAAAAVFGLVCFVLRARNCKLPPNARIFDILHKFFLLFMLTFYASKPRHRDANDLLLRHASIEPRCAASARSFFLTRQRSRVHRRRLVALAIDCSRLVR